MKNFLKKLLSKIGNGILIGIGIILSIGIFFVVYAYNWNTLSNVGAGSGLTATSWNNMIENINYLKQNQSDCIGASIGDSCGGGKYIGGGIVATTGDLVSSSWNNAITGCLAVTDGGFKDWKLPTIEELRLLYNNRVSIGGFGTNRYWSSTEYIAPNSWRIYFNGGSIEYADKGSFHASRCVRKF